MDTDFAVRIYPRISGSEGLRFALFELKTGLALRFWRLSLVPAPDPNIIHIHGQV